MTRSRRAYGKQFSAIYNDKWDRWTPRVWPFLKRTVKRQHPGAITWLDLCCGTGSLAKNAREAGYAMTGVDSSPHMLKWAKLNVPEAKFIRKDVRELHLRRRFDVVTCMFDSVNYLTQRRDIARLFRNVRDHLAPNGIFIFDVNTYAGLQEQWNETTVFRYERFTLVAEISFSSKRAIGRCLVTGFVKDGKLYKKFQEEHVERGYKPFEVEEALKKLGFRYEKYDGYSLSEPKNSAWRLLYVCRLAKSSGR